MGLSRAGGFRSECLYGRDAYGLESSAAALEAAGSNVALQQQLNDLIQNSYLLQHGANLQQCSSLGQSDASCLMPGAGASSSSYGHGLMSMGFSQSDIDRTILFDDFPPVVDHHENHHSGYVSVSNAHASVSTFAPMTPGVGLATSSSYAGSLPSMSLQPQISREGWVDGALTSLRGLKREGGLDQTNMQPRKRPDKSVRKVDPKNTRPYEQADHILRERQRRDDMTSKFAVLESLLPIGVKRDRSTIVDDSIEYVKNLHHRIKSLQERKVALNRSAAAATSHENTAQRCGRAGPMEAVLQQQQQQLSHGCPTETTPRSRRPRVSQEELSAIHGALRSCLEKMEVHADLPHQVVIEMVCKPQPRLQSSILLCLENLNLDVMQCSITKIAHRLICVITAKPQEVNTATGGIVAALKSALQG